MMIEEGTELILDQTRHYMREGEGKEKCETSNREVVRLERLGEIINTKGTQTKLLGKQLPLLHGKRTGTLVFASDCFL